MGEDQVYYLTGSVRGATVPPVDTDQQDVYTQLLRALDSLSGAELAKALVAYESACAIVGGDEDKAALWFCAYNSHLAATPKDLLTTSEGRDRLLGYLERFRLQ